ncbi:hypothetical protein BABINDRAFT_169952 [Babjeviella inositovora NRRL Y-12698]|uniref:Uncharacterized protein n=1 Tax=Babjeviella inositovora NRRL Y-12698 TaxID=984486 RepID=A0A1E3QYR9_9ASCO|nr:uncharacterized protein BABINDRAFT_169952 [Babjeviella inositovora NRRL Y-12698]ODQ82776.1 hypothetical protein BABINDRAFT_169952 [Babjeviella inositovora NRRL Y-12698]
MSLRPEKTNLAGNWSEKYTAEPHLAGHGLSLAEWTQEKFTEYGFTASIDTYDVYLSYPEDHALNLLENGSTVYSAPLKEDEIIDPTSHGDDLVPTFLGYAGNGNVTAEYIYANYGTIEDFRRLNASGVDISGKIAIVRYGRIFRGLKVKFAQDFGAVGVLIYSDPGDDFGITPANGFKQYPDGPARQESSVQRGSVQFLSIQPGDPTTPGYGSKKGAKRGDPFNSTPKIPVLPISYREIKPILARLNGFGKTLGHSWKGELPGYKYNVGPNPNYTLNLYSNQTFNITPIWNVYGEIQGLHKDEVIIVGNHRDAWIKGGAGDPNSGSAALLEVARGLYELQKSGWKPLRTIILASWDGEEYGLLGSTEFGETFSKLLQRNVVAYLNIDAAVTGTKLGLGASPVLNHVLRSAAELVPYPKGGSLYEHFQAESKDRILALGSGSDYTVFLDHLGIPSADLGFGGYRNDTLYHYHSNYDSYYWMTHFGDPGFVYHNTIAKYLGVVVLKLAEREVIDFRLNEYALKVSEYFDEAIAGIPESWLNQTAGIVEAAHDSNERFIKRATNGAYRVPQGYVASTRRSAGLHACHHRRRRTASERVFLHSEVTHARADLQRLIKASYLFDVAAEELQEDAENREFLHWWDRIKLHFRLVSYNKRLQYFERNFLDEAGLKDRSWFRHIVFAAGRYTGYAGQTLPGIREAIEDEDIDGLVGRIGVLRKTAKRVSYNLK